MDDDRYMRRALKLAEKAQGRTSPNPMVGAILVKGKRIIAEDYHRRAGTPHAEALVLKRVGKKAAGSTMYVTLEPCCHTRKRTPPCTSAIIQAGIKKVVAAMPDPNPEVSGKGLKRLKDAGIEVVTGIFEEKARSLNEAYSKYIKTGKPFVILKTAMTLDGKIATSTGESKWITGDKARRLVHRTRGRVDAILTGIGTVEADDPQLTCRVKGYENPVRVIIDPSLRISPRARIIDTPPETIIVTKTRNDKSRALAAADIKLIHYKGELDLDWLMKRLAEMEMMSVLIEGGSKLNAHALSEGIVDMVMFFIAPKIIGGRDAYASVGGEGDLARTLEDAYMIKNMRARRVGEDILIEGYLEK
jgi:diaminohydroxyphosphoribosylaminopyrimidine deaminase/5-amino-6-(5-phosphoribosylamino)uracil reductase